MKKDENRSHECFPGLPLLWFASPIALVFWLIGSSAIIVFGHASFIEPPVSSEYSGVEQV